MAFSDCRRFEILLYCIHVDKIYYIHIIQGDPDKSINIRSGGEEGVGNRDNWDRNRYRVIIVRLYRYIVFSLQFSVDSIC